MHIASGSSTERLVLTAPVANEAGAGYQKRNHGLGAQGGTYQNVQVREIASAEYVAIDKYNKPLTTIEYVMRRRLPKRYLGIRPRS